MNINRFCLFLLLTTLICIIAGMFLVFSSLHYDENPEQEIRTDVRREAGKSPHTEEQRPVFPDDYHASGLLILPHSSIAEPFEIWFSTTLAASRIDYYYGTDKSFQRGDEDEYGNYYKVVPMYNDKQGNFEGCWTVKGTKYRPVFAQTVIPNMTWFKYVETEVYTGTLATKWHYEYWAYGMLNSQYVWVTKSKPYRPIRYEMKGYDAMLGSYYDHYVLEYVTFEKWRPQMKRLEMRPNIKCFNWSLTLESSLMANPMQEFTPFSAEHLVDVDDMYKDYKVKHGKKYDSEKEHKERKHIYKHNMRYIRSMNRKKNHFNLSSNHFTDLSDEEFEAHLGSITKADPRNHTGMKQLHKHKPVYVGKPPSAVDIPEQLDWRDYGAVSSVKGQGICGSCYTFSAAGAAEGAHFLKTGNLVELSSQQILDCSWGSGNHGCKGGHYAAALSFLYLHGAATLNSYGKYLAQEGVCHFNDTLLGAKPDAFAYVPSFNNTALKRSIAKFGPAAISINVSPLSFKFYSGGIYQDADCWPNRTRHSALVIGYGSAHGKEYWIVKNSWSDTWGERGYMRVAMDGNACGVTEAPVVALVNHVTFQFPVKEKITSINPDDPVSLGRKVKAVKRKKKVASKASKAKKKTKTSGKKMKNGTKIRMQADTSESGSGIPSSVASNRRPTVQHGESYTYTERPRVNTEKNLGITTSKASNIKPTVEHGESFKYAERQKVDTEKNFGATNSELSNLKTAVHHDETFKEAEKPRVETEQKFDIPFRQKSSQSSSNDDKETPKIEPHNEKHDIGALGDAVAIGEASNSANAAKDDMSLASPSEVRDKTKTDDFKLPVLQMRVDQSKLPGASSEDGKSELKEVNSEAAIEREQSNDGLNAASLSSKFDGRSGFKIKAQNGNDSPSAIPKKKRKNRGIKHNKKSKSRKSKLNSKKSKLPAESKNWLDSIQTIDKKSIINDAENDRPEINPDKLQTVLKHTMSDLYARIDKAIVSAKRQDITG